MIRRAILLVTILILTPSAFAIAAEPGSGVIEGQVINWTEGGSSVADQDVTLKTYLNNDEVGSTPTKTDAEGKFKFDDLPTESDYFYEVWLDYQEAEYSEWVWFEENETSKSIEVVVYDSTTSDEAIKVATSHIVIYVEEDSLLMKEYFLFVNEGDRTYVGSEEVTAEGEKKTLRFSLPKEAIELQYTRELMECCVVSTEEGFVDTMPATPGVKEVSFSYRVKPSSGTFTFSKVVHYPITTFDFFVVQDEGIEVVSDQLTMEEPVDIEGTRFIHLSGQDLTPGITLEARLSGLPGASNQGVFKWTAVGLIVLACSFGFGYLLIRKRRQPVSTEVVASESDLEQRKQRLLLEIAQLDNDFDDGKISPEMYQRMRYERKMQLVKLMRQSRGKSNGGQERQGTKP